MGDISADTQAAVLLHAVTRFKGPGAQVVAVWLGDEVVKEANRKTVQVGLARSKTLLAVVGSNKTLQLVRTNVCEK